MANIIPIDSARCGATPTEWDHFDFILGLGEDLLPVVSNAKATISPMSSMKDIGKTPSRYDSNGQVVGFPAWTSYKATEQNISAWAKQKDYGVCLQTRTVRALDIDITDPDLAQAMHDRITAAIGELPARTRGNSSKRLLAFTLPGEFTKRKFKAEHGIVEFLATGQQFIALGTHPSGARYEWAGGLPDDFPILSADQFEALWSALVTEFAIEDAYEATAPTKAKVLKDAVHQDPTAQQLYREGYVLKEERDGRLHITCPFEDEHSSDSSESATTYFPAHTGGYERGHFHCLHAHCEHRSDDEFLQKLGLVDDFADLTLLPVDVPESLDHQDPPAVAVEQKNRFKVLSIADFTDAQPVTWLIKGVLPKADLGVLFGESGSGKSFVALELGMAIAQGTEWRGKRVRKGRVVYIAAEGAAGFRKRLTAFGQHHNIDITNLPFGVIHASPNLMKKDEVIDIGKAIAAFGGADLVIVDTFAQAMPGANENAGEDVGLALKHCKGINTMNKAMVLLVHHAGKDSSKGARGWSGLRAAADVEIEVTRDDQIRQLRVSKQKDGEDGAEFGFKLTEVLLGMDEDGDPITSCIVEEAEVIKKAGKGRTLGKIEKIVVEVVGEIAQFQNAGIEVSAVVEETIKKMEKPEGRDTRKQKVKKAILALCTGDDAPYFMENDCLEIL